MVKSKVIETIVEIVMVMLIFVPASIVGTKIDGKIDLVIIAPCHRDKTYIDAFKNSIRTLPDHIEMAEDKVRVAVVEPAHGGSDTSTPGARILFNMSSDKAALQKWVTEWNAATWNSDRYWHSEAFKLVRTEVFDFETKNRGKMVIQVLNGWPFDQDRENAYEEARRLRAKGAIIYVTYDPKASHLIINDLHRLDAEAYVGQNFKWRMVGNEHGDHLQMFVHAMDDILKLGDEITRDLCTFCSFKEPQTKCTPAVRPVGSKIDNFGDNNARCQSVQPAEQSCPVEECEAECNRHWPWDVEWPCSIPCVHLLHHRISKDPPPGMENCPTEKKCDWTCTTTTTTPGPTNGTSGKPGAAVAPGDSGSGGMSGTNLALIIVGVIIALVIIIAIIVVAVVVSKRKAKKKEQDAKRKKAEADLKRKQSTSDKSKHQGDEAISMRGSGSKGAEQSVGVSLAMPTKPSKKPDAKSMASKEAGATKTGSKSAAPPPKKVVEKSGKSSSVSKTGSMESKGPMQKK